jgi:hypothetical protein
MGSYVAPKTGLDIRTQDVVTKMESVEWRSVKNWVDGIDEDTDLGDWLCALKSMGKGVIGLNNGAL